MGGRIIKAHRGILAEYSDKYDTQIEGSFSHQIVDGIIKMPGYDPDNFEEFLKFPYGMKPTLKFANILDIMRIVDQAHFHRGDNFNFCIEYLEAKRRDNLCKTFQLAREFGLESLYAYTVKDIQSMSHLLFKPEDFTSLYFDDVSEILKLESFTVREHDVFSTIVSWAKNQCTEQKKDPNNVEDLRAVLVKGETDLLHMIRFGTLKEGEFNSCYQEFGSLFTDEEAAEIRCAISQTQSGSSHFNHHSSRYKINIGNWQTVIRAVSAKDDKGIEWGDKIDRDIPGYSMNFKKLYTTFLETYKTHEEVITSINGIFDNWDLEYRNGGSRLG